MISQSLKKLDDRRFGPLRAPKNVGQLLYEPQLTHSWRRSIRYSIPSRCCLDLPLQQKLPSPPLFRRWPLGVRSRRSVGRESVQERSIW
ncbi:hypothetical protein BV22DRAFT_148611 [Leucogyrophana mollusca]|uniref:Uncharacterized protein n=1 Tax=Leucogyrophana mollusca TaxID=85980 RepID=A0ACB8BVV5_9AGAM|nr:hypothetical protein BV22DRAFT_148611 [Leucogyrophana mollusca]